MGFVQQIIQAEFVGGVVQFESPLQHTPTNPLNSVVTINAILLPDLKNEGRKMLDFGSKATNILT